MKSKKGLSWDPRPTSPCVAKGYISPPGPYRFVCNKVPTFLTERDPLFEYTMNRELLVMDRPNGSDVPHRSVSGTLYYVTGKVHPSLKPESENTVQVTMLNVDSIKELLDSIGFDKLIIPNTNEEIDL